MASNVELSPHFLSGIQAEQEHPVMTKHAPEAPPASCSLSSFFECFVLTANQVIFALQKQPKIMRLMNNWLRVSVQLVEVNLQ